MNDEAGIWRQYAEENRQAARLLFASGLWNPCLQNCQQAVEKYLKAALVKTGHAIRKTHHIKELAAWLREKGKEPGLTEEDCELLDTIYLPSKYPLGAVLPYFEPNARISTQCLEILERVARATGN